MFRFLNSATAGTVASIRCLLVVTSFAGYPFAAAENDVISRWDVQDNRPGTLDSGALLNVEDVFDGFALLHVQVEGPKQLTAFIRDLNLTFDGVNTWDSLHPAVVDDIVVSRRVRVSADGSYVRYVDVFSNLGEEERDVEISFGGSITRRENAHRAFVDAQPVCAPAGRSTGFFIAGGRDENADIGNVSALVYGSTTENSQSFRLGSPHTDPFADDAEPGDAGFASATTRMRLLPGETRSLMFFVVSSNEGPTGEDPVQLQCETALRLLDSPDTSGLTPIQRLQVTNWPLGADADLPPMPDLQQASIAELELWLRHSLTEPEDLVFAYLERIAFYDRNGLSLNAIISINPDVYSVARELVAEGHQDSAPLWGMPYISKDNIDIAGYPTSIGVRALAGYPVESTAPVIERLTNAGAIFLAKSNMDDFALGGFSASSVAGKTLNMFSTLHNPSGSSGGSAVATSVGMGAFSLGTDTCRSLSNPASYMALTTMRPTRERVDISGIAPLYPMQDVVGPLTRFTDDLQLVLNVMLAPVPDGGVASPTAPATERRLGIARQRFIGFSGDTAVADALEPALEMLRRQGMELVDMEIPNLDELFEASISSHSGIFKGAINGYLQHRPTGPSSLGEVVDTGLFHARSDAWLREELTADDPSADLLERTREGRSALRAAIIEAMDKANVQALIFPAAHTQPDPMESMRWALGTCKLSAQSGLPQVTAPITLLNDRWPLGVSLLGRPNTEDLLLSFSREIEALGRVRERAPYLTR